MTHEQLERAKLMAKESDVQIETAADLLQKGWTFIQTLNGPSYWKKEYAEPFKT